MSGAKIYDLEVTIARELYGLTAKPDEPGFTAARILEDDDDTDPQS